MNLYVVDGYLTRDPELRYTQTGKEVCNFTIANNERFGQREITTFIDVAFWGRQAQICNQYLRKGSRVLIQGRIERNDYEDNMGIKKYKYSIVGDKFDFLDKAGDHR